MSQTLIKVYAQGATKLFEGDHPMQAITTIGVDLAKNTVQIHRVDAHGKTVLRKSSKRDHVAVFFANLPSCIVGMEACATSGYWARVIESYGHSVRRIHPKFVKPYLMADKERRQRRCGHLRGRSMATHAICVEQDPGTSGH
jgi:transposase